MLNKRGQITVFIIIGILLLFAFAFAFYIYNSATEKIEISARPIIEDVPTELNPLVLYVEDCIRQTATRGLIKIGENGGYINPDDVGEYSSQNPTDSDGILISENSNTKVPYWLYNDEENDELRIGCSSLAPALKRESARDLSIETQLDKYVNEELVYCLNDFNQFKTQGYEITTGDIDTTTTIVPNKITFFVEYPVELKRAKTNAEIDRFYTEISVPLKQMYDFAHEITNAQSEYKFLERNTLNLMESFSGLDINAIPPMTDSTFEFGKVIVWPVPSVEENIKNMLTSYVPMMRVHQSLNNFRYDVPAGELSEVKQRVYDNMMLDLGKTIPYKVKFDYLNWPIYFDVNDNAGTIMPQSASISYSGLVFGVQRYKSVYDVSYPVLVTLEDPNALNNEGYSFTFALESNIRNNKKVDCGDEIRAPIVFFEESMMCNENQRNSEEYKINVKDNYDNFDLSGVQVTYTAGEESCFIAETESDVVTKLPIAYGGLLTFIKQNYLSTAVPVDTSMELPPRERNIQVKMNKYADVVVSVKKKKIVKCLLGVCHPGSSFPSTNAETGWILRSTPAHELTADEEAIVTLKRISDTDEEFVTGFSVVGDQEKTIRLVPGKYEVTMQLVLNEEVKIPAQVRCEKIKAGIIGEREKEECYVIDEVLFDVFPSGGIVFDTEESYWELKPNNLYNANKITFMAASIALDEVPENLRVIEDVNQISEIEEISKNNMGALSPRIE